jgi:NADH/NAD ratio-sensing transcriptional regulator Rex
MSSLAGYNVKEEATEVKKNLFENRDTFVMLVIAGVVGGAITRFVIPKSVTEGSIFSRVRSWIGLDD